MDEVGILIKLYVMSSLKLQRHRASTVVMSMTKNYPEKLFNIKFISRATTYIYNAKIFKQFE